MGMGINQYGEREESLSVRGQAEPKLFSLSSRVVGADASNKLSGVYFKLGDRVVTEAAEGEAYEIFVDFRITIDYIRYYTLNPPGWRGDWKVIVAALCPGAGIYVLGDYTTPKIGWPTEIVQSNFRLGDYFSGSNPRVMGKANQAFTIYLLGSASTTVSNPTPAEIMAMPVH